MFLISYEYVLDFLSNFALRNALQLFSRSNYRRKMHIDFRMFSSYSDTIWNLSILHRFTSQSRMKIFIFLRVWLLFLKSVAWKKGSILWRKAYAYILVVFDLMYCKDHTEGALVVRNRRWLFSYKWDPKWSITFSCLINYLSHII